MTSRGTGADRLQRHRGTRAGGPGGSAHSPGSWPGSRVPWGWPRPAGPCLCFSCLARIRSILWTGDGSEHRARQENTPSHPGPPDGTYCLFSWARDFSSALRWKSMLLRLAALYRAKPLWGVREAGVSTSLSSSLLWAQPTRPAPRSSLLTGSLSMTPHLHCSEREGTPCHLRSHGVGNVQMKR